jgi:hypothetical protein
MHASETTTAFDEAGERGCSGMMRLAPVRVTDYVIARQVILLGETAMMSRTISRTIAAPLWSRLSTVGLETRIALHSEVAQFTAVF